MNLKNVDDRQDNKFQEEFFLWRFITFCNLSVKWEDFLNVWSYIVEWIKKQTPEKELKILKAYIDVKNEKKENEYWLFFLLIVIIKMDYFKILLHDMEFYT